MLYKKIVNVGFAIKSKEQGCSIIGGMDDPCSLNELDVTGKK